MTGHLSSVSARRQHVPAAHLFDALLTIQREPGATFLLSPVFSLVCVLAIWLDIDPHVPLVVGANRDELLSRPSAPPSEIEPGIVAGKDLESGGTWLGYTRDHLFVAITNRRLPMRSVDSESRGQVVLSALRSGTLQGSESAVRRAVTDGKVAGFNLVAIRGTEGICFEFDGSLRSKRFGRGIHVVSSDVDFNSPDMPEKRALDAFVAEHPGLPDEQSLREFLGSHDGSRPICKHGEQFGTVSSTILSFAAHGARMLYADGPSCRTPFLEVMA